MAKIDKYNLKASPQASLSGTQEVTENLQLTISPISAAGTIKGKVTSGGTDLSDAVVKVFSISNVPLFHTNSGPNGQYNIPDVTIGSYLITAAKNGYLTPVVIPITVSTTTPTIVNIDLTIDSDKTKNTIFGLIKETLPPQAPVENAIVVISSVVGAVKTTVATTQTNSSGQYIAPYLTDGDYSVDVNKFGYFPVSSTTITVTGGVIVPLDLLLVTDPQSNLGTVDGFITDSSSVAIANATVALYSIALDGTETIIQLTKSNASGRYLFCNVPTGNYIVKSFQQITV